MKEAFLGLVILTVVSVCHAYDWSTNPGDGTPENPYQLSEPNHLIAIGADPNLLDKHFILTSDITFDPENIPTHIFDKALIAPDIDNTTTGFQGTAFTGVFNGAHHKISYLTIVNTGTNDFIGLFGYINGDNKATEIVKDLTLYGTYVETESSDYVGSLAGRLENGTLRNCIIEASSFMGVEIGFVGGNKYVGGLAGHIQSGDIKNCSYDGQILGGEQVGGLVGWIYSGLIKNCTSSGSVYGFNMVGGIVGRSGTGKCIVTIEGSVTTISLIYGEQLTENEIIITDNKTDAYVSGDFSCGGLVGILSWGAISKCFSNATVRNIDNFGGGFAGCLLTCSTENCYANIDLKSKQDSGGFCGAFSRGSIANCYCVGIIDRYEGWMIPSAFIGFAWEPGTVEACYHNTPDYSPPFFGTKLTDAQMKQQANFTGWDFVGDETDGNNEIWRMCADGVDYPRLSWEFAQNGDFACPDGTDLTDLQALAQNWLTAAEITPDAFNYACDTNADEHISLPDFSTLAENW